jgi:hypothetical protein
MTCQREANIMLVISHGTGQLKEHGRRWEDDIKFDLKEIYLIRYELTSMGQNKGKLWI